MELIQKYFSDFTPQQLKQLAALKELYKEWNEKINVISRKDIDNFYLHHVGQVQIGAKAGHEIGRRDLVEVRLQRFHDQLKCYIF